MRVPLGSPSTAELKASQDIRRHIRNSQHYESLMLARQPMCMPAKLLKSLTKRACRGSACTCQLLKFCNVINSRQPCAAFVNFLSSTQFFLLCIDRYLAAALRASSMRFAKSALLCCTPSFRAHRRASPWAA